MRVTWALLPLLCLVLPTLGQDDDRPRHPLAPSLPLLTEAEEKRIEKIIDRFIDYDTGKLKGAEGKKALADFNALGPEAIPLLIDGLNRAANMASSCPAVIIGRKLGSLLNASRDLQLLDFARENIGAGVTVRRHMGVISDLKLACMLRKSYLVRNGLAQAFPGVKPPTQLSTRELVQAAGSERGPKLKKVLVELERRQGEAVINALAAAATSYETDIRELAGDLLQKNLSRLSEAELKKQFQHERPEVRMAAARVAGQKKTSLGEELIRLLEDRESEVQQAARQALVELSRGQDFGPLPNSPPADRDEAIRRWRAWWNHQKANSGR